MERLRIAFGDPTFWKLEHCCFAWDLKAGAVISTITGFTVILCALLSVAAQTQILYTNAESDMFQTLKVYQAIHYSLAYVYLALGVSAFAVTFVGSYLGHYMVTLVGTCLAGVTFLFWLALTTVSYFPENYRMVCIQTRCPDLHWFVESRWRNFAYNDCQITGERFGTELIPIQPPPKLPYPRWFTARTFYDNLVFDDVYLDYLHHKRRPYLKTKLSVPDRKSQILSKRMITNANRRKENQLKRNKRRKKHRKMFRKKRRTNKKNFKRKYVDEEEEEELVGQEYEEKETSGGDAVDDYDRERITDYIPLHKLAPPVETLFKPVSIFLALLWGVFMVNTLIVLIYYLVQLYDELPIMEEGEENF